MIFFVYSVNETFLLLLTFFNLLLFLDMTIQIKNQIYLSLDIYKL